MSHLDWPVLADMQTDLRHWRAFVAAAETQHFHAAAELLGISQPALSQLIRTLETNLGSRLFDRQGRRIKLSAAGEALLPEAQMALSQAVRAEMVGRAISRGETRTLTAGYVGSAAFHPSFTALISAAIKMRPPVTLKLNQLTASQQVQRLVEQTLDFAMIRSPLPILDPALMILPIHTETMVLALPADDIRAAQPVCQLKDFAGDPFIQYIQQRSGGLRGQVEAACRQAGFEPRIAHTVPQIATMLCLVGAHTGVALVPQSMMRLALPGVAYCELHDPVTTELILLYRRSDTSPALRAILKLARGLNDKLILSK
jgi:DNA-binding transcriptional LysR family regulator